MKFDMENKYKILELLNNELDKSERSKIWQQIQSDPAAEHDYLKLKKIKDNINTNATKINAPPALKQQIMSKTIVAGSNAIFDSIRSIGVFTGIIALLYMLISSDTSKVPENLAVSSEQNINSSSIDYNHFTANDNNSYISDEKNVSASYSKLIDSETSPIVTITQIDNNIIRVQNVDNKKDSENELFDDKNSAVQKLNFSRINSETKIYKLNTLKLSSNISSQKYDFVNSNSFLNKFSFEISFNSDFHIPQATIDPASKVPFNNTSFGLKYKHSENLHFIADYRRENFFQIYTGNDFEDGLDKEYRQTPNFNTFGLYLRYSNRLLGNIDYFIQPGISISAPGVMPRLRSGLYYELTNSLALILSAEYSHMFFTHQNNIFDAQKIGIHYGLSYNF